MTTANVINAFADLMDDNEQARMGHVARDHVMENARIAAADFAEGRSGLDGYDNIKSCVNNPTDNALTPDGEKLFKFIGHSYTFVDESISKSAELLMGIELAEERQVQSAGKMAEAMDYINTAHTRRLQLDGEYQQLTKSDSPASRAMLRSVMSEIEDSNEFTSAMSENFKKFERESEQAQVDLDAARFELDQLRKISIGEVFNAKALLFTDPKWRGMSSVQPGMAPRDKETMKNAFLGPLLTTLKTLDVTEGGTNDAMLGVVSLPQSVFTEEVVRDIQRFKQSEIAKKVGNVYKLIKSLRDGKHDRILYDDVILADSPQDAEENALLNEVYFLNLTAMAGYDPMSWAQAFGVPISGIGKQILSEWGNGRMGPLTPERLIKLFENKSYAKTASINYQELELKLSKEDREEMRGGEGQSLARTLVASMREAAMEEQEEKQEGSVE